MSDTDVVHLQQSLLAEGWQIGRVDGIFGLKTLGGVRGRAGYPRALEIASQEYGVREVPGAGNNPRIEDYHAQTWLGGSTPDSVPWCSSFLCFVAAATGVGSTGSPRARSWLGWGFDSAYRVGAVAVLRRGLPPAGHVGLLAHWTSSAVWLLGGNQGDAVSIRAFPRRDVLGVRLVGDWCVSAE